MRSRLLAASVVLAASLLVVTACTAASDTAPDAFLGGGMPSPEATITPAPDSWSQASVPAGFRVVALAMAADPAAETVLSAVRDWADAHGVSLETEQVADGDALEAATVEASESGADLVIGAGSQSVDVLALITSQLLDTQFLVIAGQLAEPTANVTAVIWPGAGFRGTGITPDGEGEVSAVTPERARTAIEAGYASVAWGITGIVVQLP